MCRLCLAICIYIYLVLFLLLFFFKYLSARASPGSPRGSLAYVCLFLFPISAGCAFSFPTLSRRMRFLRLCVYLVASSLSSLFHSLRLFVLMPAISPRLRVPQVIFVCNHNNQFLDACVSPSTVCIPPTICPCLYLLPHLSPSLYLSLCLFADSSGLPHLLLRICTVHSIVHQ